ncbi:MAG: addiction module protein [Bacteroidota bacterium]|nr:addiction module protein [Bacteroidota bacterium]
MTTADLRAEIMQMITDEEDTSILEAIRTLLGKLRHNDENDDLSDDDVAELERRRADRKSGKVKFLSEEEFTRSLRERPIE